MGAHYVVLRGCRLQQSLGEDFVHLVKRHGQLVHLEGRREEIERVSGGRRFDDLELTVTGTGRESRKTTIHELRESVALLADTSECSECPLAGGRPLGCYRSIPYPVDPAFEEKFFAWFRASLTSADPRFVIASLPDGTTLTAAQLLLEEVLPFVDPDAMTAWESMRGPAESGGIAAREEPIEAELEGGELLSSADALALAFAPAIDGKEALQLYAHLFKGFVEAMSEEGADLAGTDTLAHFRDVSELLVAAVALPEVSVFVDS